MAGVKDDDGVPAADLGAMYTNYLKGWAFIDLAGVAHHTDDSASKQRAVRPNTEQGRKVIRLVRLAKLLSGSCRSAVQKVRRTHWPCAQRIHSTWDNFLIMHTITCLVRFELGPGYAPAPQQINLVGCNLCSDMIIATATTMPPLSIWCSHSVFDDVLYKNPTDTRLEMQARTSVPMTINAIGLTKVRQGAINKARL